MNQQEIEQRIKHMVTFVENQAYDRAKEISAQAEHEYNLAKTKHLHTAKERLQAEYDKKWK
jgi:hypothetical protein